MARYAEKNVHLEAKLMDGVRFTVVMKVTNPGNIVQPNWEKPYMVKNVVQDVRKKDLAITGVT